MLIFYFGVKFHYVMIRLKNIIICTAYPIKVYHSEIGRRFFHTVLSLMKARVLASLFATNYFSDGLELYTPEPIFHSIDNILRQKTQAKRGQFIPMEEIKGNWYRGRSQIYFLSENKAITFASLFHSKISEFR